MKNWILVLLTLFILATLPAAVYLVKQRQEIRKEAAGGEFCCTRPTWIGFPENWFNPEAPEETLSRKIHYRDYSDPSDQAIVGSWSVSWCDYFRIKEKVDAREKDFLKCEEWDEDAFIKDPEWHALWAHNEGYTPPLEELIEPSWYDGQCQVIQVDVSPCKDWGVCYVVYANPICPTPTPTPTPTVIPTPTPTITPTPTPTPTPTATPTPTPTPTLPPTCDLSCTEVIPHNSWGDKIEDDDWESLSLPQTIRFVVEGWTDCEEAVTKARFTLDGGLTWHFGTFLKEEGGGYFYYWERTFEEAGCYDLRAEVYTPRVGWR